MPRDRKPTPRQVKKFTEPGEAIIHLGRTEPDQPADRPQMDEGEMERMVIAADLGKPFTPSSPSAARMFENIQRQVAEIKAKGGMVEIPFQWPDITDVTPPAPTPEEPPA